LDHVDPADIARPRTWDIGLIRNFMLILGPVSSLFDFLTFFVLLKIFHAHESLFHTGWFIESLATQVLVIFVIRTKGNPLHGLPHPLLVGSSVAAVAIGAVLPFTFFGPIIGFTAPPLLFFELLAGMTIAYLGVVELIKRWFFRRHGFPSKQ
jgi:Mg2+-importing ATPase